MLKKVIVTNYLGESMEYLIDGVQVDNPSGLIITSIDGLGPVKANINMMDLATTDGQLYNSARLSGRNIVIKALFTHASSIEVARLLSYKYFPIKSKVKIRVETDNRIGETEGYVESNEPDIFSEASGCQISIVCESAYFDGGEIKWTLSDTNPLFKFPIGNPSLTEPLIKVSERMNSQLNPIIYEGDTDTGAKFTFGLPTDDALDSFSVSKIELTKNGSKKMSLDLSKMSNVVPNTAPKNVSLSKCSFFFNENKAKYLNRLPYAIGESETNSFCFVHKDRIHCIFNYQNEEVDRHLELDPETNEWTELHYILQGDFSFYAKQIDWLVSFEDTIYAFSSGKRYIYRLDETNNKWVTASDKISSFVPIGYAMYAEYAIVCNGEIHCFCPMLYGNSSSYYHLYHLSWNPNTDTWTPIGEISLFSFMLTEDVKIIPYNDTIAILNSTNVYLWNKNSPTIWITIDQQVPFDVSAAIICEYNGRIHACYGKQFYVTSYHKMWDEYNGWRDASDLPFGIMSSTTNEHILAYNGYIYVIGPYGTSYTEEANNIKLIENDQLVINTIKGKKSISLLRGENKYDIINTMEKDSTWFELQRGTSYFSFSAEGSSEDKLRLTISTNQWYEGV